MDKEHVARRSPMLARPLRSLTLLCAATALSLLAITSTALASEWNKELSFGSSSFSTNEASPSAVAVEAKTGDVFAYDGGNKRVVKVSPSGGTVLGQITGSETAAEEFISAETFGIAVDNSTEAGDPSKGDVYVNDFEAGEIYKFAPNGSTGNERNEYHLVAELSPGTFVTGVAVDSKGDLFLAGFETHKIYEFDAEGNKVGETAPKNIETTAVWGLAVNAAGTRLYAAANNGLYESGLEERTLVGSGVFWGVAVDTSGNVYGIAGSDIYEFEVGPPPKEVVEAFPTNAYAFSYGVAYNPLNERLYVSESTAGEMFIFEKEGTSVELEPPPVVTKYTLAATTNGNGAGTVECSTDGGATYAGCAAEYEEETELVLKETPSAGSEFTGWNGASGSASLCEGSSASECSFKIEADTAIAAGFALLAPVNTSVPVISGTPQEGRTLKTTNGAWDNNPSSYAWQWEDCEATGSEPCTPIGGATSDEYTLTSADLGRTVRVTVTAENAGGSASAASAYTAEVTAGESNEASGNVHGSVPKTQSLESTCQDVSLGEFIPAEAHTYHNTCGLTATSTTAESQLVAEDKEPQGHAGYLVNYDNEATGSAKEREFALKQALEMGAEDTENPEYAEKVGASTGVVNLTGGAEPLMTYGKPVSADKVTMTFKQKIGAKEGLHTGEYAKTITVTLATIEP
jgi:Divergent InlB B-repeat domain